MTESASNTIQPPQNPAGDFESRSSLTQSDRGLIIEEMEQIPRRWQTVINQLPQDGLDVKYRNWTIRQITHHIADSHANSYIRFKWALTEIQPRIKAYDEAAWVALPDSTQGDVEQPLAFLKGIHIKWCQLLSSMTESDFQKTFVHPETDSVHKLDDVLQYYPWHSRHHLGQILWLARQNEWPIELDY